MTVFNDRLNYERREKKTNTQDNKQFYDMKTYKKL
jgi:hypothetical protein